MTLQQLKYIFEIARYGSISKAAQNLCLTQPYLSGIVKSLENELNITIFERNPKGITLTNEGSHFLKYAKPILEHEKFIMDIYGHKSTDLPFIFTISMQHFSFGIEAFYQFLNAHCSPNQKYEIHLRECSMDQVIKDVAQFRSEIGIISTSSFSNAYIKKHLASNNLQIEKLVTLTPKVFFRKTHPLANKPNICMEDLLNFPFASYESHDNVSIDFLEEAVYPNVISLNRHIYVTDRATMINTLTHTDAFSIGSGILSDGYAGPKLISRSLSENDESINLGWIHVINHTVSEDVLDFLDIFKNNLLQKANIYNQDISFN